jgi:calcineurin-like phosphoesterase family protein
MNILLTTDTHFGHAEMHQIYGRPENFENRILRGIMKVQGQWDVLLHLGDFAWKDKVWWAQQYFAASKKSKALTAAAHWLVRGNHDQDRSNKWYYSLGFDWIGTRMDMDLFGYNFIFTHEPMRLRARGNCNYGNMLNIHGHWHNERADIRFHNGYRYLRKHQRGLALENRHYQPVPLAQLAKEQDQYLRKGK